MAAMLNFEIYKVSGCLLPVKRRFVLTALALRMRGSPAAVTELILVIAVRTGMKIIHIKIALLKLECSELSQS